MNTRWYCTDCETEIDREEIDDHESEGHHVKGMLRPERLLSNDPWTFGSEADDEQ